MSGRRLPEGGLIARGRPLRFRFDGREYMGFEGDTLASALLASGERLLGRSFKYHRPRSVWGAWVDEPNAIMNVRLGATERPNCLATTTYLEDGMEARSVNAWPSARFDLKAGLDLFHRWLGAGFYYKTFIWPDWHLFEPAIRKMAGLGAVDTAHLDDFTADQVHASCDLLVVGGGPAGLSAARAAAEAGQDVVLVDDHRALGGSAYRCAEIDGQAPADWVAQQRAALDAAGARLLTDTTAAGIYDHGLAALVEHRGFAIAPRLWRLRAGGIVLATGALDRPITFAGNDLPGVMSLAGATDYLARYGVLVGGQIAVCAPHALFSPDPFRAAGARVREIDPSQTPLKARGGRWLTGLETAEGVLPCDTVLASAGATPLVHLWRHAGGKLDWCETRQAFVPGQAPEGMTAVGAANGTFDLSAACAEAQAVGAARGTAPTRSRAPQSAIPPLWPDPEAKGRQWIDFQHDVTLKDITLAARENYRSVEHLKRYTTLGMAIDQGKTSNMTGLAAMAAQRGVSIPEVGTTTFRPPYVPVPIETYRGLRTGQSFHPVKRLALEAAHRDRGAALCEYGGWLRPGWYGDADASHHIQHEAKTARSHAGIFDASPLGKIEIIGPDAEAFLNFVFYNTMKTLAPGRLRYGFLLTEGGAIFDDGVLARLAPEHFVFSCSSSHVDAVRLHLEAWRQDGNDPDRIFIHDMTQAACVLTVTGPKARAIVSNLDLDIDFSVEAFAHMTWRAGHFQGAPIRVARVSFTGDTSFEITVPHLQATTLWARLLDIGAAHGAVPLGLEALAILRAEKGYIMVGKDTDGETMPHDLGFEAPRHKKTAAYVGDRSLHSAKAQEVTRKQLVGLEIAEGTEPLVTGAHVISDAETRSSLGYVTSSYISPTLERPIALALVAGGTECHGTEVTVWHDGATRRAKVTSACAFDPEGARLHAG